MLISSNYIENKEKYESLFRIFLKNKDLDYPQIIVKINEEMKKKYNNYADCDLKDFKTIILYIKKNHSTLKADIMTKILSNSMKSEKEEIIIPNGVLQSAIKLKSLDKDFSILEQIKSEMDTVINEKKSCQELLKEGKIKRNNLFTDVKKNIKYIETERYLEFLKVNYNLQPTSLEELDQYLQVIKYFIKNLEDNFYKFNFLIPETDEIAIRNFPVSGEEKLDPTIKNNIGRLYIWKLNKIESLLERYRILEQLINNIIINKKIDVFKTMDQSILMKLKENEEFIIDYYNSLREIKKIYDMSVKKLSNVKTETKIDIEEKFNKKFIKENNN